TPAHEVGTWVDRVAAEALSRRTLDLSEIEGSTWVDPDKRVDTQPMPPQLEQTADAISLGLDRGALPSERKSARKWASLVVVLAIAGVIAAAFIAGTLRARSSEPSPSEPSSSVPAIEDPPLSAKVASSTSTPAKVPERSHASARPVPPKRRP